MRFALELNGKTAHFLVLFFSAEVQPPAEGYNQLINKTSHCNDKNGKTQNNIYHVDLVVANKGKQK